MHPKASQIDEKSALGLERPFTGLVFALGGARGRLGKPLGANRWVRLGLAETPGGLGKGKGWGKPNPFTSEIRSSGGFPSSKRPAPEGAGGLFGEQPFVYLPETITFGRPPEERNPCIRYI